MKIFSLIVVFLCLGTATVTAQESKPVKFKNDYYNTRIAAHKEEGLQKNAIIFVGNSITEQGWWRILFNRNDIENRGIGGDNTFGMLDRFPDILKSQPRKIFFMGGVNDLSAGRSVDTIAHNIALIIRMAHEMAPNCQFYVQSVLPVNDTRLAYASIKGQNERIKNLNEKLKDICARENAVYIDIAKELMDEKGELQINLTKDGIHLHPEAYQIWANYLKKNKYLK